MNPMIPPPEPARHGINETLALNDGIAETLALVDRIRRIAFDRPLADDDIARRIRDAFRGEDFGEDA